MTRRVVHQHTGCTETTSRNRCLSSRSLAPTAVSASMRQGLRKSIGAGGQLSSLVISAWSTAPVFLAVADSV